MGSQCSSILDLNTGLYIRNGAERGALGAARLTLEASSG